MKNKQEDIDIQIMASLLSLIVSKNPEISESEILFHYLRDITDKKEKQKGKKMILEAIKLAGLQDVIAKNESKKKNVISILKNIGIFE